MSLRPTEGERGGGFLLLRRQGGLWACPAGELEELPRGRPPRVRLKDGRELTADELLGMASTLDPRPVPHRLRAYLPKELGALAVWRQEPVAILTMKTRETNENGDRNS